MGNSLPGTKSKRNSTTAVDPSNKLDEIEKALIYGETGKILEEDDSFTKIELSISCEDIPDRFKTSPPNIGCATFIQDKESKWILITNTEARISFNPEFVKKSEIRYYFERKQFMKISVHEVLEINDDGKIIQNLIGYATFWVHDILKSPEHKLVLPISNDEKIQGLGNIKIFAKNLKSC